MKDVTLTLSHREALMVLEVLNWTGVGFYDIPLEVGSESLEDFVQRKTNFKFRPVRDVMVDVFDRLSRAADEVEAESLS